MYIWPSSPLPLDLLSSLLFPPLLLPPILYFVLFFLFFLYLFPLPFQWRVKIGGGGGNSIKTHEIGTPKNISLQNKNSQQVLGSKTVWNHVWVSLDYSPFFNLLLFISYKYLHLKTVPSSVSPPNFTISLAKIDFNWLIHISLKMTIEYSV